MIVRQIMGFMMYVAEIIWLGNSINGGSKYLEYITGLDGTLCKLITVLGFGIYVFLGGYFAVVTTDAVQFIILIAGFLFIAIRALPLAGGYANVVAAFEAADNAGALSFYGIASYGLMPALALFFSSFCGVIGSPTCRTRIYTAKSEKTARTALLGQGGFVFVWGFIVALIAEIIVSLLTPADTTSEEERLQAVIEGRRERISE